MGCMTRLQRPRKAFIRIESHESHYIGVTYAFQQLLTHPGQAETQTHSALLFYTLYLPRALTSLSLQDQNTLTPWRSHIALRSGHRLRAPT